MLLNRSAFPTVLSVATVVNIEAVLDIYFPLVLDFLGLRIGIVVGAVCLEMDCSFHIHVLPNKRLIARFPKMHVLIYFSC